MQNGSFSNCSGTFFDSGGEFSDYGPDENLTITLCPDSFEFNIALQFTSFDVANDGDDSMIIYDGNTVDNNNIIGIFTGDLASNPELSNIETSPDNDSGCLTIVFISNENNLTGGGWEANINCVEGCPAINPGIDSISPVSFDGENYLACVGNVIVFDANSNVEFGDPSLVTYTWNFDNGDIDNGEFATTSFSSPGFYNVTLTANYPDCNPETIILSFQVGNEPIIELTSEVNEICAGDQVELNANAFTEPYTGLCGLPITSTAPIPNGNGQSYTSSIFVECFDSNQVITSPDDIFQVCLTLEHTFLGDLEIVLISPNNTEVVLKPQPTLLSDEDVYLGEASEGTAPGTGFEYCFTTTASALLANGNTVDVPNTSDPDTTNPSIVAGQYLPFESFNNFIGSPINGNWHIEITDNIPQDDGWIFEWSIDFDTALIPEENIFQPQIIKQEWIGFDGQGNTIFVTKPTEGEECYEFEVIDNFGCIYVEEICIEYLPSPIIGPLVDINECDNNPENFAVDLTINTPNAIGPQDPSLFTVSYHTSANDALTGDNPIPNPESYIPPELNYTIYVSLILDESGCIITSQFDVTISEKPVITQSPQLLDCGDFSLTQSFNLTLIDALALGISNPENFLITYHTSQSDAQTLQNAIPNPLNYTPISTDQTIWIRVENITESNCNTVTSFTIEIFDVEINKPNDLSECAATGNTGQHVFDLTLQNAAAFGPNQNSTTHNIFYYTTESDAINNTNAIQNPSIYQTNSANETIWVRVENSSNTDCFEITNFTLTVIERPEALVQPQNLNLCGDFTLNQSFNLSINNLQTLNIPNPSGTNITYHNTLIDADLDINPIPNPATYSPSATQQTIFIRLENTTDNTCYDISSFNLEIFDIEANEAPDLSECVATGNTGQHIFDLTQQSSFIFGINQNSTTHTITYHTNAANANAGVNSIPNPNNYLTGNANETIWARVENNANTNCFETTNFTLTVIEQPEILNQAIDLSQCGDFSSQQTFNLTVNNLQFLQVPAISLTNISYHISQNDANLDINAIQNPNSYLPVSVQETIYIRLENTNDATCFITSSFSLEIFNVEAIQPNNLSECVQTGNTGQHIFDLTQQSSFIFGSNQNSTTHTITYHTSAANANAGVNSIPNPNNYLTGNANETIWARVENISDTSCFEITNFELTVIEQPEVVNLPANLSQCGDFSLSQTFDLTVNNIQSMALPDADGANITYHNSQNDADFGVNAISNPTDYSPNNIQETIYIRLENSTDSSCFVTTNFNINLFDVVAIEPLDISECVSTGNTGIHIFDLTQQTTNILGQNQNEISHNISYHTSLADANTGNSPIVNPGSYQTGSANETIWARVENNLNNTCFEVTSFELIVIEQPEITNLPLNLSQCGDFSFNQIFNLTENNLESLGILNISDTTISYYTSASDADLGVNAITNPSSYSPGFDSETIFIRLENSNDSSCYITADFTLDIFNAIANTAPDFEACDTFSEAGTATFNLLQNNSIILGLNQTENTHNITYHTSLNDAQNNLNQIDSPGSYQNLSNPQTIYARVENILNPECFAISSFELSVPIVGDIDPLVVCDDDNDGFFNNFNLNLVDDSITQGNLSISVTYHLTINDAENNVGALSSPYANVVENAQTIFYRAFDAENNCFQVGNFEIQVVDSPLINAINEPLIGCDENDDETLFFDLTQVENDIIGDSLNPQNLSIDYYLSLSDAESGVNPINQPSSYQNISNPQTVWVRVTDISNPFGCYDVEPIELQVSPLPNFVFAEPFSQCDDEAGGGLDDEVAVFDFNDIIDEITEVNNELLVEFFENSEDLDNDNPIQNFDNYENTSNPQTIFVRITSGTTGCVGESNFTIFVKPTPSLELELEPLEICDRDNDGFEEFDLAAAIPDILNNEPDVTITFHLSQGAADLGINAIDTSTPFGLINPNLQTIYVRAENTGPNGTDGSGCFDTKPLDLIVYNSPEIQDLQDLSICDDESANGFASFDLTENTPLILGNQNANDVDITYHETQIDAETGVNPIAVASNYTNLTNPQTIYVRIENHENGCYDLFNSSNDINNTFTLTVESLPIANPPTNLQVCNDNYDDSPFPTSFFDLTVKEPEIAGVNVVPDNLQFSYFETQADLDNNVNAIEDPTNYANLSQPQDIFVRVEDTSTENACFNSTIITISVLPLPSPSETDPDTLRLEVCDDDNDGIAATPFDLTISGVLISENENVILSYYTSENGAVSEDVDDLITNPSSYVNDPSLNVPDENGNPTNTQIIYVRVDNNTNTNFCFVIVQIEIVVQPAPQINPIDDLFGYTLCEDDNTDPGIATIFSTQDITENLWNLNSGNSNQIIPLLNPNTSPVQNINDFNVSYHLTEEDAENGINPIPPGYQATNGEIFFIRVTNIETECYNTIFIAQLQIVIEPRPAISDSNPDDIEVCADSEENQNIATVDLTVQDIFINPNDTNITSVLYYDGMENYNNGTPIENPSSFETSTTPQTIVAEVINTTTLCESASFVSFEILVRPVPVLNLEDQDLIICFDEDGFLIENDTSPPTIDTGLSSSNFSFVWTLNGQILPNTNAFLTANTEGTYGVTAINNFSGCESSATVNIIESTPPAFDVNIISPAFGSNHTIEVNVTGGTGNFEFQLDDGEWISLSPGQTSLVFSDVAIGTHIVRGRDDGGCGIIERMVTIIDYPPFFTPNEDGFNDTWNINGLNQPDARIFIFDRYGKLLKQLKPDGLGWDGTFNGKPMPPQSYWFRIDFREPLTNEPTTFRSHFILKR